MCTRSSSSCAAEDSRTCRKWAALPRPHSFQLSLRNGRNSIFSPSPPWIFFSPFFSLLFSFFLLRHRFRPSFPMVTLNERAAELCSAYRSPTSEFHPPSVTLTIWILGHFHPGYYHVIGASDFQPHLSGFFKAKDARYW